MTTKQNIDARKGDTRWVAEWYTRGAIRDASRGAEFDPDKLRVSSEICESRKAAEKLSAERDFHRESRVSLEEFNGYAWAVIERYVCGEVSRG
jgi:hypothetical protein